MLADRLIVGFLGFDLMPDEQPFHIRKVRPPQCCHCPGLGIYIYIYIYNERERERETDRQRQREGERFLTVRVT